MSDPEVYGGFLLVRRLAESAMASVHLAVRLADASGRPLVLKRAPFGERASGRAAQALLREAEVLGEVRGAGIPALEGAGEIAGLPYVALERLRGASLAKILAAGAPLSPAAVRAIGRDVGRALAKLHAAGWVHRDVTPSNVLVDDAGEGYLLDFGLCAHAGDERGAALAGTRGYVAPEAATSPAASPAQDVYGLAVCLAEAALGRRLFDEGSLVEAAGRGDAPREVAALEAELPRIGAALRRDPGARPTAEELAGGLDRDLDRGALAELSQRAAERPSHAPAEHPEAPAPAHAVVPFGPAKEGARGPVVPFTASPPIVTPTMSMPLVTVREAPLPTLRDAPGEPARLRAAEPGPPRSRAGAAIGLLVIVLVTLLMGFLAGRVTARGRASFSVTGPTPKRAEIHLDGRKLTIAEGVPMNVSPGPHTLTVVSRSARREIPFSVRPGEHVVILYSTSRAPGQPPADDDSPP